MHLFYFFVSWFNTISCVEIVFANYNRLCRSCVRINWLVLMIYYVTFCEYDAVAICCTVDNRHLSCTSLHAHSGLNTLAHMHTQVYIHSPTCSRMQCFRVIIKSISYVPSSLNQWCIKPMNVCVVATGNLCDYIYI